MVWLADSYDAIYKRAQYLSLLGDREGAIGELSRLVKRLGSLSPSLLERKPDLKALLVSSSTALAELLRQAGRHDEAIELKGKLAQWDEANKGGWLREVGALLIQKGEVEEGLGFLKKLGQEEPREYLNWLALALELGRLERLDEGKGYVEEALKATHRREDRARIWITWADLHRQAGHLDQAAEAWEEMAKEDAEAAGPFWVYSMYVEAGDFLKARKYLAMEKNKFLANFYAGLISLRQGNAVGAERTWRMMVPWEAGEDLAEQETWAEACLRTGNASRVATVVGKYLEKNRASVKLVLLLGIARAAAGELDSSRSTLKELGRSLLNMDEKVRSRMEREAKELLDAAIADEALRAELSALLLPSPEAQGG